MKTIKKLFVVFVVLLNLNFILISYLHADYPPREDCCNNGCGKIEGKVIDPVTNQKVNIPFNIWIGYFNSETGLFIEKNNKCLRKTNNDGTFSFKIDAGIYYLQFLPDLSYIRDHNLQYKYAFDPDAWMDTGNAKKVEVKTGQVVNIIKKAKLGGTLKIILVDQNGNKVNLKNTFNSNAEASLNLVSPTRSNVIFVLYSGVTEKLNEGEETIPGLLQSFYDLNINFDNIGYGIQNVTNIKIESQKVTEVKVLVDINDSTGIEGNLTDSSGNPLDGFSVSVLNVLDRSREAMIETDKNGYFKIIGLREKDYILNIFKLFGNEESYLTMDEIKANSINKEITKIHIKNGLLIKKNILIENELLTKKN